MRVSTLVLVALALTGIPAPISAQETGWAVVVGIDDYTFLDGLEGGDLLGAEHDAVGFADYVVRGQGLPPDHVLLLLGAEATGSAIREGLSRWLQDRVAPGDRVYVFFAGHGSQALDVNGDEADGLDETLAPADALPLSGENDILDDEIHSLLSALNVAEIVVILDSCSSGTATKALGPEGRRRSLERPLQRPKGLGEDGPGGGFVDQGSGRVVELAAAAPHQAALDAAFPEADDEAAFFGGAFTTHLLKRLWSAPDSATLLDVLALTRADLRNGSYAQEPQFSGPVSARVGIRRRDEQRQPK